MAVINNDYFYGDLISLPSEMKVKIGRFSNLQSLLALSTTSKEWYRLTNEFFQKKMFYGFAVTKINATRDYTNINNVIEIAIARSEIKDILMEVREIIVLAEKLYLLPCYNVMNNVEIAKNRMKIAIALKNAGETEEAEEMLTLSKDAALLIGSNGCKSAALMEVALGLEKTGNTKEANEFLILSRDIACSIPSRSQLLMKIAAIQIEIGSIEEAKNTIQLINDFHYRPTSLLEVTLLLVRVGDIDGAKSIFRSGDISCFCDNELRRLSEIALSLLKAGDTEGADEFFILSKNMVLSIKNHFFKNLALKELSMALAKAGSLVRANATKKADEFFTLSKDMALFIGDNYLKTLALIELATNLVKPTKEEEANELFQKSYDTACTIEDVEFKTAALIQLATALAEINDMEKASNILTLFKDATLDCPNESLTKRDKMLSSLTGIAIALAEIGNMEEANKLLISLKEETFLIDRRSRSSLLSKIAEAQTKVLTIFAKSGEIMRVKDGINNMREMGLSDIDIGLTVLKVAQGIEMKL